MKQPGDGYVHVDVKDVVLMDNVREVDDVKELVASIKAQGIIEPLVARRCDGGQAELVCGYRRLAAAKLAGLKVVPVVFRELADAQVRELQLTENLHRQDLGPLDEARAFRVYLDATKATQQVLADKVAKGQPYIAKRLALLELPDKVQKLIVGGKISVAHAETLATVPRDLVEYDYTGREVGKVIDSLVADCSDDTNPMSSKHFSGYAARHVAQAQRRVDEMKKWAAMEPCPKCNSPPESYLHDWMNTKDVVCPEGHAYDSHTGKPVLEERVRSGGFRSGGSKAPVKKSRQEPGTIRSMHDAHAIVTKLLRLIPTKDIMTVKVSDRWSDPLIEIHTKGGKGGMPFSAEMEAHVYKTGEKSAVHLEAYTDPEKKKAREAFRAWEEDHLPKRVAKEPPLPDVKLLEGTIAKVVGKLQGKDDLVLEELRKLEAKGKARAGVLDFIDARLKGA